MKTLGGELVLRLQADAGGVRDVRCESTRPRLSEALVRGMECELAAQRLGVIYTVCGGAQRTTAECACESAMGRGADDEVTHRRDLALATELAQEHLWHFLMELPRWLGRVPPAVAMRGARERPEWRVLKAVACDEVYGVSCTRWAEIEHFGELLEWSRQCGTPAAERLAQLVAGNPALGASTVALMPDPMEGALRQALIPGLEGRADFPERPLWSDGAARETGALARMPRHPLVLEAVSRWGRSVVARHVARLAELFEVLQELEHGVPRPRHGAHADTPGTGYAWAHTARGLLVHRAKVVQGRVAGYDVVAPTEWNFHPAGAFAAGARAIRAADARDVEREACTLAVSLDPCVAWRVEVGRA